MMTNATPQTPWMEDYADDSPTIPPGIGKTLVKIVVVAAVGCFVAWVLMGCGASGKAKSGAVQMENSVIQPTTETTTFKGVGFTPEQLQHIAPEQLAPMTWLKHAEVKK